MPLSEQVVCGKQVQQLVHQGVFDIDINDFTRIVKTNMVVEMLMVTIKLLLHLWQSSAEVVGKAVVVSAMFSWDGRETAYSHQPKCKLLHLHN